MAEPSTDALNRIYGGEKTSQPETATVPEVKPVSAKSPSVPVSPSPEPAANVVRPMEKPKRQFLPKRWHKVLAVVLLVFLFLGGMVGAVAAYTFSVVQEMKFQANELQSSGQVAYDHFKAQNLPAAQEEIKKVREKFSSLEKTYSKLSFYKAIPVANLYYADGEHGFKAGAAGLNAADRSLNAVAPYADVLGFKGEGSYTGGGTAEDRLKGILQALEKITPELDAVSKDLDQVKTELAAINPGRYPETIQGKPVRSSIQKAQEFSAAAVTALTEFRPAIERLPAVAGADGKRKKYFILFQNPNELRATGGFLTAYSIIYVENGKVTPEKSDDIYELDKKFRKNIPIPPILGKYLTTEKRWNLRDMNTSPDFRTSMEQQFLANYKDVPGEPKDLDGIIAVDTHVLVDLLKILGPVEVPGYGTFSAENSPACDCPQVVYALSEIITRPTPFIREDRKGVLGPLMRAVLTKAYSAPKTQWPELFESAWKNVQGRHVQMYYFDPKAQDAAEVIGAAGRMKMDANAQDFFAIIDANLGGAKSNLFITNTVQHEVSAPSNGSITKKVTITYKNSRKADNCNLEAGKLCLNSTLRDWNRVYVPKGAKLVSSNGFRQGTVNQYDEGEFTVIDGEFTLEPLGTSKLELEYTVPYTDTKTYKMKIWKQGGIKEIPTIVDVAENQEEIIVIQDTLYQAPF